jgi:hypothetical protein
MTELPSLRLADYVLWWTTPEKCGAVAVCADCGSHRVEHPAIRACTTEKHLCNARQWRHVPNNADVSNPASLDIAQAMLSELNITQVHEWQARQSSAALLEKAVRHFAAGDGLMIRQNARLGEFAQYRHLRGRPDDWVNLDVTISRDSMLIAALELKTTLRADRARGAKRNLHAVMTKHDGSNAPIAAVVTGEPLPGRLAKCVAEMGDRHTVYHVDRQALARAIEATTRGGQFAEWRTIEKHIRDFSDLLAAVRTATA